MNQIGMGSYSDRVYCDGLQVVVNLSNRELTSAENSLLSEGLSFCRTPQDIDIFTLRKDLSDFVRCLPFKELVLFNDGDIAGDFSDITVFRKRSTCSRAEAHQEDKQT